MKNLLMGVAGVLLLFAGASGQAAADEVEAIKDAAWNACVAAASDRYDSAEVSKKAKKKKIGRERGYIFSVKTVPSKNGLRCFANKSGDTTFYR